MTWHAASGARAPGYADGQRSSGSPHLRRTSSSRHHLSVVGLGQAGRSRRFARRVAACDLLPARAATFSWSCAPSSHTVLTGYTRTLRADESAAPRAAGQVAFWLDAADRYGGAGRPRTRHRRDCRRQWVGAPGPGGVAAGAQYAAAGLLGVAALLDRAAGAAAGDLSGAGARGGRGGGRGGAGGVCRGRAGPGGRGGEGGAGGAAAGLVLVRPAGGPGAAGAGTGGGAGGGADDDGVPGVRGGGRGRAGLRAAGRTELRRPAARAGASISPYRPGSGARVCQSVSR